MGRYHYTESEKEINKVLKYQQDELADMEQQITEIRSSCDAHISESEVLLKSLGYDLLTPTPDHEIGSRAVSPIAVSESWDDIVQQAEEHYPYDVELEDILSQAEFENAYRDLKNINKEFRQSTKLDGVDLSMVIVAAALQTLRWALMPAIGAPIDKASRMTSEEGDELVKKLKKEFAEKHKDWPAEKKQQGRRLRKQEGKTWKEIISSGVPDDAIKGSKAVLGTGLSGNTHRYKTLGHDPVLGWVFGTSNILTDTLTLNNLTSYRVEKGVMTNKILLILQLFVETSDQIQSDKYKLPAAVFRQALHYKSDMYTKDGLPVPLLGVFSEALAAKLYSRQYDFLCFVRDSKIEGISAVLSILINMVISLIHGLYYDEGSDGNRDLFEVRTRKILLYSNTLASTGNIAATLITKNAKMLDIGGLLVTISRLYTDARFIARAKEEFIQGRLDDNLRQIVNDADALLHVF
jgi:hypothetical protein